MWCATPGVWMCFSCFMIGVFALIWVAWVNLYRIWRTQLHRKPISSVYQAISRALWIVAVLLIGFFTSFMLWGLWVSVPDLVRASCWDCNGVLGQTAG